MGDDFFSEPHIQSVVPRASSASGQLQQLEAALTSARTHLAMLRGKCAHNALAIGIQEKIIKQYESRIAGLKSEDWINE